MESEPHRFPHGSPPKTHAQPLSSRNLASESEVTTPTKSQLRRKEKVCVICQRILGQPDSTGKLFKRYKSITKDIAGRLHRVVGQTGMAPFPSQFICYPCETTLGHIEKRDGFVQQFEDHMRIAVRPKRMAVQSPANKPRAKRSLGMDTLPAQTGAYAIRQEDNEDITPLSENRRSSILHQSESREQDFTSIRDTVFEQISAECEDLCSTNYKSKFRLTDTESLQAWSYTDQETELQDKAPTFLRGLQSAAINERSLSSTKAKHYDTIRPGIMSAAGTLLQCRNKHMVAHGTVTGLQLKSGGATKETHRRLQSRSLSVSYPTIISKQKMLGIGFNKPVIEWKETMEEDANIISELRQKIQPLQTKIDNKQHAFKDFLEHKRLQQQLVNVKRNRDPGFQLVGDNIDFSTNPRQFTTQSGRKSLHYFNFLAVKNRISGNDKDDLKPARDIKTCPLSTFLPTHEDNLKLRREWAILMGRIVTTFLPAFQKYKKHIPAYIPHEYSNVTKQKTEAVGLGVIFESEIGSGIVKIMDHMNQYVPHGNSDDPIPIISAGDQLTCEREDNAQEDRRNCPPAERWSGMLPEIADFHTLANFYEWIWKQLYTTDSRGCKDIGTLYAAKVFLKATDVKGKPTQCFYAFEELLDKYLKALTLAAAMDFFGMSNSTEEPSQNKHDPTLDDDESFIKGAMESMVDRYAIQHEPDAEAVDQASATYQCKECNKKAYKTRLGLKKHIQSKHPESPYMEDVDRSKATVGDYCRTAMAMILLAHNFTDARKCGDGERIIRLYKFLTLHFKAANKSKYAFASLRLQAQIQCLLPERLGHVLTWNRFVNNKGLPDSNVEMDRENEHRNKVIKQETRNFYGKLSDTAIKRVGEAAQNLDQILQKVDREARMKTKSGKHSKVDTSEDVLALTDIFSKEKVFQSGQDRQLHALPDFQKDPFSHLDLSDVQQWMTNALSNISRRKVFSQFV